MFQWKKYGNLIITGVLRIMGTIAFSTRNAITAFPAGGQANAVPITTDFARITVCATAGDSVKLPRATVGREVCVVNSAALGADVFPEVADTINSQAINTAYRQPANTVAWYACMVAGQWQLQVPQPAAKWTLNATAGATVAAAGDLTGAQYVQAGYSGVNGANLTTRTAAQMIADANLQVGDSYVLEITNTSAGTTTVVAGAGVTLTGTMTIATNTTRRFNVRVTGAATITIQSTGVGTIS
jgi:hypothetical protein